MGGTQVGLRVAWVLKGSDRFFRGHGLGNDYLVFDAVEPEGEGGWEVTPPAIRRVCQRGEGEGADGLLVLLQRSPTDEGHLVRGFNPDGTEFERSGNGLRVLASYLSKEGLVGVEAFRVRFGDSTLLVTVHEVQPCGRYDVSVEMGRALVGLRWVNGDPVALDPDGRALHPSLGPITFVPVSVGNPHAVVFSSVLARGELEEVGPFLARHPAFAEGTNVQFVDVVGPDRLRIGVWERGAGQTSASGTSSCAAVVAAVSTGRLEPGAITVEMEGGTLLVSVTRDLEVTLRGPAEEVAEGRLTPGFMRRLSELV